LIVAQLQFDAEAHVYTLDGVRVPSVTQIIKPIGPDFSMVPPSVLEAKRHLGVVVHEACQYDDEGDLDDESVPAEIDPYLAAWRKFKADTGAVVLWNEQRLHHDRLRYAGTIDRVVGIGEATWLIDLKTSASPHASYGVQLAGYAELLTAGGLFTDLKRATVHLYDDGTYRLHEFKNPNDAAAFMACLSIHQWKEANK
jgi:hypothetical protein